MAVALSDTAKDVSTLPSVVGPIGDNDIEDDIDLLKNVENYNVGETRSSAVRSVEKDEELLISNSRALCPVSAAYAPVDSSSIAIYSQTPGIVLKSIGSKLGNNSKNFRGYGMSGKSCRFPKLEECAHFHYERVQLGSLCACLVDDKSELLSSSIASESIGGDVTFSQSNATTANVPNSFCSSNCWFIIKVFPHMGEPFLIKRSFSNMQMLDEMMHRCVYDRKISGLKNLSAVDIKSEEDAEYMVVEYLERFSKIASDSLTCGTILTWFQVDNKGRRLPLADTDTMQSINTPAVGAAYGVRRYQAQATDEISIEVGDMISVIDMPSPAESIWWRGKKSHLQKSHYEVGFFPQSCVAIIGDKVPRYFPMPAPLVGQLDISPTKPVLRKHGKLIAFFRSFILSRPSRRRLKQSGIYRERVFSCDLSEHLLNSGQDIPMVLQCCAEFIEEYGIVDGIYRLSGITSNIQKLRRSFDEECIPDMSSSEIKQDIHAVSSLLKMYFRELPNPLCTYQLYDNFVEAIQTKSESSERLRLMKETVLKLPPPHYRTLRYLSQHLNKISQHSERTGMTDKNLAIVWAPNLLRCPALESGGVAALRGVGVQAVVTEYLIRNCNDIFEQSVDPSVRLSIIGTTTAGLGRIKADTQLDSLTDCESLLIEQREHDQSLSCLERPKSLSSGGPKLISLEEAQERHSRFDNFDIKQSMPINMMSSHTQSIGSYIEVGGGPSSLPDKYHTVLSAPRNWQKRKTNSWKALFTRSQRSVNNGRIHCLKDGESAINPAVKPPRLKDIAQVTFTESDASMVHDEKCSRALGKQGKPKSVEFFDTSRTLGLELKNASIRSTSIESMRTTGHSRSVSHDSYFDILQSPHRGHISACLTRELSELGINFDREEPEMRLFSDCESLISSPRALKENVPNNLTVSSRRILRARPEDFSSQTNSVNPSPKKQPRLNIFNACSVSHNNSAPQSSQSDCVDVVGSESYCKRYKLEDVLSDIQYIDCNTPEHTAATSQPLYSVSEVETPTLKEVPNDVLKPAIGPAEPPTSADKDVEKKAIRNSYPTAQLRPRQQKPESVMCNSQERFSYPVSNATNEQRHSMHKKDEREGSYRAKQKLNEKCNSQQSLPDQQDTLAKPASISKALSETFRQRSYDSYSNPFLATTSTDTLHRRRMEMERSKLSVTPCSQETSPRYSLLTGETSSENSSCISTPQCEVDPIRHSPAMPLLYEATSASMSDSNHSQQQFRCTLMPEGNSRGHYGSIITQTSPLGNYSMEERDMKALKKDLCLDLYSSNQEALQHDQHDIEGMAFPLKPHLISPNNSNFTDNTSQSVTPSEFGYQHLQRHSSMHSLLETEENSLAFEDLDSLSSNKISPCESLLPKSPLKSTINITYNLKGNGTDEQAHPSSSSSTLKAIERQSLLETSFDEDTVYEQVKFFRNSVTEVNELLKSQRGTLKTMKAINSDPDSAEECCESDNHFDTKTVCVEMAEKEKPLYENVELRRPQSVYENMLGEDMRSPKRDVREHKAKRMSKNYSTNIVDDLSSCAGADRKLLDQKTPIPSEEPKQRVSSSTNFSVKELANKFESTPSVQQQGLAECPARSSIKVKKQSTTTSAELKSPNCDGSTEATKTMAGANSADNKLTYSQKITRSLDENAFVREFDDKKLNNYVARSTQQLPELIEFSKRCKSVDFMQPKTLNPPKRLPGMPIAEELCTKNDSTLVGSRRGSLKEPHSPVSIINSEQGCEIPERRTNSGRASRSSQVQTNQKMPLLSDSNTNATISGGTSLKALSDVKLNRERIDKIKEERRQQLTQKYRGDSFKSKSKLELYSSKEDEKPNTQQSSQFRSKSRGDLTLLKDNEKSNEHRPRYQSGTGLEIEKKFTNDVPPHARSTSDVKNQNYDFIKDMCAFDLHASQRRNAEKPTPSMANNASKQACETKSSNTNAIRERWSTDAVNMGVVSTASIDQSSSNGRSSFKATREKISPQISIRDMAALFESRTQNPE